MEPKFVRYIKFNGYLIILIAFIGVFDGVLKWIQQLETGSEPYAFALSTVRNHIVVDGCFLLAWIIAIAALYQAVCLEVEVLLYPIGYLLGIEATIVVVQDLQCWWTNDTEESFLRSRGDVCQWAVVLVYFYYTLHILGRMFRHQDRSSSDATKATDYSQSRIFVSIP